MKPPHLVRRTAAAAALTAAILSIGRPPSHAQEPPAAKSPATVLEAALRTTQAQGVATVVVFTAPDQPASVRFWTEFNNGAWARSRRGLVQLVNISKHDGADLVRLMEITRFPSVVIFARGSRGVSKLGTITDCDSPEGLVRWLRVLETGAGRAEQTDASVRPTLFGGDVYASQQYPPQPQAQPQLQAQPQYQPQPQPTPMMTMAPPMVSTSAAVVQVPSQNLMIQQAPPQVFLAPQPAPVVYVPQVAAAAPTAPAANLFMASQPVAAAPAPQPSLAAAPAPATLALASAPAPAPAPAATLALAAGPQALAVNNQMLSLPSTGTLSKVRVAGPGFLQLGLSRLGERLVQLGRTRIVSTQVTTLEAPRTQAPAGGLTTISSTTTTPVAQQPTTLIMQPSEEVCQHRGHPPCQHQPRPVPTPQNAP
jgi:hypothetical protein